MAKVSLPLCSRSSRTGHLQMSQTLWSQALNKRSLAPPSKFSSRPPTKIRASHLYSYWFQDYSSLQRLQPCPWFCSRQAHSICTSYLDRWICRQHLHSGMDHWATSSRCLKRASSSSQPSTSARCFYASTSPCSKGATYCRSWVSQCRSPLWWSSSSRRSVGLARCQWDSSFYLRAYSRDGWEVANKMDCPSDDDEIQTDRE